MAKPMTSAQSLLGLVSQLQNMESSFTAILMEAAMKLAGLTDANVFLLVESQDGRRFSGKRYLCDAYMNGSLLPCGNDAEFEVNPAVSALQLRRTSGQQQQQQQQQMQQQQHQSRVFPSASAGREFSPSSPFSSPPNRPSFSPQSPSSMMRKRQFPKPPSTTSTSSSTANFQQHTAPSSSPLLSKYPRVSPSTTVIGNVVENGNDRGANGVMGEEKSPEVGSAGASTPAADPPVRVKDEAAENAAEDNTPEIIDESSITHSNPDVVALQQQHQSTASSGKGSTTSSSSAANGLEINAWETASGGGGGFNGGGGGDEDYDNGDFGDFYGGGAVGDEAISNGGFSNGSPGDELELMNLLNANLSSQKINTLKCITPINACVKGTPENRLSTSLCYDFGKALAEAKPDDMDEIQAREFFFKNFELWVSQFDNLKTVFQKALPHGRPESGQTLTLLGFMRMSARSGFAQRSKRLKQLRENEQQRQFAGALMHGVGIASW